MRKGREERGGTGSERRQGGTKKTLIEGGRDRDRREDKVIEKGTEGGNRV